MGEVSSMLTIRIGDVLNLKENFNWYIYNSENVQIDGLMRKNAIELHNDLSDDFQTVDHWI